MSGLTQRLGQQLSRPPIARLFRHGIRRRAVIFMLHRFAEPERGIAGHDPRLVRAVLEALRRDDYLILPLADLLGRLAERDAQVSGTIAFTVDDGYADFARVGARLFAEFDPPVTVFTVTGFIDGRCWLWWDQVEWLLRQRGGRSMRLLVGDQPIDLPPIGPGDDAVTTDLVARLKIVPDAHRRRAVADLAESVGVALPAAAPDRYAPMSWNEIGDLARRGVTCGPHTDTHPILSRVADAGSREEITRSVTLLRAQVPDSLSVFCYPNGDLGSFGTREVATLRSLGMTAAVAYLENYASRDDLVGSDPAPFAIPRHAFPRTLSGALQIASGLERVKQWFRRGR